MGAYVPYGRMYFVMGVYVPYVYVAYGRVCTLSACMYLMGVYVRL